MDNDIFELPGSLVINRRVTFTGPDFQMVKRTSFDEKSYILSGHLTPDPKKSHLCNIFENTLAENHRSLNLRIVGFQKCNYPWMVSETPGLMSSVDASILHCFHVFLLIF